MPYKVDYDLWINVRGIAELDFKPESPDDMTDYIFSDECCCEIMGVMTDPAFCGTGYMEVTAVDDEEE